MVDCIQEMAAKNSERIIKYGSFKHLLLFFLGGKTPSLPPGKRHSPQGVCGGVRGGDEVMCMRISFA